MSGVLVPMKLTLLFICGSAVLCLPCNFADSDWYFLRKWLETFLLLRDFLADFLDEPVCEAPSVIFSNVVSSYCDDKVVLLTSSNKPVPNVACVFRYFICLLVSSQILA